MPLNVAKQCYISYRTKIDGKKQADRRKVMIHVNISEPIVNIIPGRADS